MVSSPSEYTFFDRFISLPLNTFPDLYLSQVFSSMSDMMIFVISGISIFAELAACDLTEKFSGSVFA